MRVAKNESQANQIEIQKEIAEDVVGRRYMLRPATIGIPADAVESMRLTWSDTAPIREEAPLTSSLSGVMVSAESFELNRVYDDINVKIIYRWPQAKYCCQQNISKTTENVFFFRQPFNLSVSLTER